MKTETTVRANLFSQNAVTVVLNSGRHLLNILFHVYQVGPNELGRLSCIINRKSGIRRYLAPTFLSSTEISPLAPLHCHSKKPIFLHPQTRLIPKVNFSPLPNSFFGSLSLQFFSISSLRSTPELYQRLSIPLLSKKILPMSFHSWLLFIIYHYLSCFISLPC